MSQLALVILCSSVALILHTYLLYPVGMVIAFRKPRLSITSYPDPSQLPEVGVIIAAYNEEKVIAQKIRSVYASNYPLEKICVYVGSDASTDGTDTVIRSLQAEFSSLHLVAFPGRVGKIGIINQLQQLAQTPLLVLTDANVFFEPQTLYELCRPFANPGVGLVAANIDKVSENEAGIARQEKKYLSMENRVKAAESNAFGLIMGAEGGCYAIRRHLFVKVPERFIVDDFFITMKVIGQGSQALFNPLAHCTEDAPIESKGEFRRKVRISAGNFQNLVHFRGTSFTFWKAVTFCFWSHKILRWLTPMLLLLALAATLVLTSTQAAFLMLLVPQLLGLLSPVADKVLGFKSSPLKFISHFYLMNLALLFGFFKFVVGIKSNIWQPVKRNV